VYLAVLHSPGVELIDEVVADRDDRSGTSRNPAFHASRNPADQSTQLAESIASNDPDRLAVDVLVPEDIGHSAQPERQREDEHR